MIRTPMRNWHDCDLCGEPIRRGETVLNGHHLHSDNAVPEYEKVYGTRPFPVRRVPCCRDRWIQGERP